MSYIPNNSEYTRFNEQLVGYRLSPVNLKPTWGVSDLRYDTTTSGTGASTGETNGEFLLQSGTDNNGLAQLSTILRGLYRAGAMGQAGIGVRIPVAPTSTTDIQWGYTDFTNGFYFGWDSTGKYVAYITGGAETKFYQTEWNVDKLNGTGPSGKTLDLTNGLVTQIDFTWYGYGDIEFSFLIENDRGKIEKEVAHRVKIDGSASIIDPNQPLSFRVENGASGTTNTQLYIGGHQFSTIEGDSKFQKRQVSELISQFTTATNTNWQPIIAVRKKQTFNGRANSVNVKIDDFEVNTDGDCDVRLTVNTVTNTVPAYGTPTNWTANETAVETKTSSGTAITTLSSGYPVAYTFATTTNRGGYKTAIGDPDLLVGIGQEVVLWIRRHSSSGSLIVKNAHITWDENW